MCIVYSIYKYTVDSVYVLSYAYIIPLVILPGTGGVPFHKEAPYKMTTGLMKCQLKSATFIKWEFQEV